MDLSVEVNIILCILSFVLTLVSVVTVVITLIQNNKMIESTSRPYVGIYTQSVIIGEKPTFYLVIKNFGQSSAQFKKFCYTPELKGCFNLDTDKEFLKQVEKMVLAPNQSRICMFDYDAVPEEVCFEYEYSSPAKKQYKETVEISMKAAINLPTVVSNGSQDNNERIISHTLQEMLKKSL